MTASTDPLDFSDKRAAVTGAAGGIGRAVALLLLERGASVIGADLADDGLAPGAAAGGEGIAADIGTSAGRNAFVRAAGPVDHVVVAHGIVRP